MSKLKLISFGALFIVVIMLITIAIGSSAPQGFQGGTISIPKGQTLSEAAKVLYEKNFIRSEFLFKVYATLLDKATGIKTGDYLFTKAESVLRIALRLVKGETGFPLIKVTVPEGSDSTSIASIISKAIPTFDKREFGLLAKQHEGYLFPETYFWPANVKPEQVITDMTAQFDIKIATIKSDIASSKIDQDDAVNMASIIEREAITSSDRRIVAGILWKRLDAGMALQVDASFYYILRKASNDLTSDDLKIDSPYNLYTHAGLPPGPIANPGLEAIKDAINPTKTKYWYYLSDKRGVIHYAEDLEGHVANKYKYLN